MSFAKRQLEKMGWKEGEGLGLRKDGIKTFLKVEKRNAKEAIGLGHNGDPNHLTNHLSEYDSVFAEISAKGQSSSSKQKQKKDHSRDAEQEEVEVTEVKRPAGKRRGTPSPSSSPALRPQGAPATTAKRKRSRSADRALPRGGEQPTEEEHHDDAALASSSSSSAKSKGKKSKVYVPSSSSDDEDGDGNNTHHSGGSNLTFMSDKDLFAKCGGVRLGRAGRHRFFDGKLQRIEESHKAHK